MAQAAPISENSHPLAGKVITVLGGSGFFGRHLAQELLSAGARLRIACRHPKRAFAIRPLANLGQVQFAGCDVTRSESLAGVLAGSDMVVNLVGSFSGDLDAVQGRGAGRIAAAARGAGAAAMVHVSAIGANADSDIDYARTKAEGETAVLTAFPSATIIRPSILFGPDDNFINMFARLIAAFPALPVFGPHARLQPVFVDDAAAGIASALSGAARHGGKTFEVAGPEVVTMLELNQRIAAAQGRQRMFVPLADQLSGAIATVTGWLPGAPITSDQWELLKAGNVADPKAPGLKALGVTARPIALFLDRWMVTYRKHGRFGTDVQA